METATRMGSRSSSRHGPAIQFSGRVRKWQKTWTKSGTSEKLQVFKWLPVSGDREDEPEDLPVRKYRFLPLDIVHAQARAVKEAQQRAETSELETAAEADTLAPDAEIKRSNEGPEGAVPEGEAGLVSLDQMQVEKGNDGSPVERTEVDGPGTASGELPGEEQPGTAAALEKEGVVMTDSVRDVEGALQGEVKENTGVQAGAESAGRDAVGSFEAVEKDPRDDAAGTNTSRNIDGDGEGGEISTAGEIAESLVATGLVEEGDAAKVEARALARVVALDAMEQKLEGPQADAEDGDGRKAQVWETGGAPGSYEDGRRHEEGVPSQQDGAGKSRPLEKGPSRRNENSEGGKDVQQPSDKGPEELTAEDEQIGGRRVEVAKQVEGTVDGLEDDAVRSGLSGAQEDEQSNPDSKET